MGLRCVAGRRCCERPLGAAGVGTRGDGVGAAGVRTTALQRRHRTDWPKFTPLMRQPFANPELTAPTYTRRRLREPHASRPPFAPPLADPQPPRWDPLAAEDWLFLPPRGSVRTMSSHVEFPLRRNRWSPDAKVCLLHSRMRMFILRPRLGPREDELCKRAKGAQQRTAGEGKEGREASFGQSGPGDSDSG